MGGGGGEAASEWGQERGRQTERLEEEAGREQRGKRGKKSKEGSKETEGSASGTFEGCACCLADDGRHLVTDDEAGALAAEADCFPGGS